MVSITSYLLHPLLQVVFHILANQTSSCSFSSPLFLYQACFIKSTCSHAFLSLSLCSPSTMNISLSPQLIPVFIVRAGTKALSGGICMSAIFPGHAGPATNLGIQLAMNSSAMELVAYIIQNKKCHKKGHLGRFLAFSSHII